MIDKKLLLDVINNFEENPNYEFSIKTYKSFVGPEDKEMIYIVLLLEKYSFSPESMSSKIFEIKKRIQNILSFDRVILTCDLKSDFF